MCSVSRNLSDRLGEAKACGNLGNTLKVMGHFDEAIDWCQKHLAIAKELGDRVRMNQSYYSIPNQ